MNRSSPRLPALAILAAAFLAGCGKPGDTLVPVSGQVIVDGKPAAGAAVALHPVDGTDAKARPVGQVDENGNFELTTNKAGDGVAPGEYRVTLTWYARTPGKKPAAEGEETPARNLIPDKYTRADSTPLTATVRADGADPLKIEISTKPARR